MSKLRREVETDAVQMQSSLGLLKSAAVGFATGLAGAVVSGLAFGAVVSVFKRGAEEFRQTDDANRKLEASLRNTGLAASVTAGQINEIADKFEHTRLVSANAIKDAAGQLASFKGVTVDTFETALGLAQDLSSRFSQDLKTSIQQVGAAFQDPIKAVGELAQVGVSFNQVQIDTIKYLSEYGDKAGATKIILDELRRAVGGSGEAEASGLTGAYHQLNAAIGDSLAALFEYTIGANNLEKAIRGVAGAFNFATDAAQGKFSGPDSQLEDLRKQYADLVDQINKAKEDPLATPNNLAAQANIKLLEKEAADIQAQINAIQEQLKQAQNDQRNALGRAGARNADLSVPGQLAPVDKPLDVQAEYEDRLKREQDAAKRAQQAKDREAKAARDAQARLDDQRLDDFNDLLDKEIEATQKAIDARNERERKGLEQRYKDVADYIDKKQKEEEKAQKEADRLAEKQQQEMRDILLQPWKDLASAVSQITADMFEEFLTEGKVSLGQLATGLNDTFKKSLAGAAGNLVTQPLNNAISEIATGKYGSVTEFAKANPNLTAAAGGYVFGSLLDTVRGKETYAGVGGAVGGAAGAAIGTYFLPGVGTAVGGALGSVAGSTIGSLFGAGGGLGNDRSQQVYTTGKQGIAYSDNSFSAANRNVTSTILGQVGQLQEYLGTLGATFKDLAIEVTAGNKSGITVAGQKYGSNEEALQGALKYLLKNAEGLSGTERTVIQNTRARTVQDVQKDLGTAKEFDAFTYKGQEVGKQLKELSIYYTDLARRSKELGLDTDKLAKSYADAAQKIKDADLQMRNSFNRQLDAIFNDSALSQTLAGLEDQFDALVTKAKELGYSTQVLGRIEEARRREREQAIQAAEQQATSLRQQISGQYSNINGFFSGLIDPLQAVNQNAGGEGALAKITKARKDYEDTLTLAKQGDLEATQQLAGKAQTLEALRQQYLGSSGLGAEIAREVQSGTKEIIDNLQSEQKEALASLPEITRETTKEHIAALEEQTDRMVEELEKLRKDIALQRKAK